MITRIVRLTFKPQHTSQFVAIFERSSPLIHAFEGCLGVRLLRDVQDSSVFFTISKWESAEHLNRYRHSELFVATWASTKKLFAAPAIAHSLEDVHAAHDALSQ
jgi:heme-degrading monooxygenase HmoA